MQKKILTFPFIEQNRQTDRQTENESSVGLFGCLFSPRRLPSVSGVPKERKKERKSKTLTKEEEEEEEEEARRELKTSSSSEEKKKRNSAVSPAVERPPPQQPLPKAQLAMVRSPTTEEESSDGRIALLRLWRI
jgi:hypothetical protein